MAIEITYKGRYLSLLARDAYAESGLRPPVGIARLGKKAAGRELDGRIHDAYPQSLTPEGARS